MKSIGQTFQILDNSKSWCPSLQPIIQVYNQTWKFLLELTYFEKKNNKIFFFSFPVSSHFNIIKTSDTLNFSILLKTYKNNLVFRPYFEECSLLCTFNYILLHFYLHK